MIDFLSLLSEVIYLKLMFTISFSILLVNLLNNTASAFSLFICGLLSSFIKLVKGDSSSDSTVQSSFVSKGSVDVRAKDACKVVKRTADATNIPIHTAKTTPEDIVGIPVIVDKSLIERPKDYVIPE